MNEHRDHTPGGADRRIRIALFGLPGAGKSTSAEIFQKAFSAIGLRVAVIKLAAPLYDVQEFFYSRVRNTIRPGQQDGALLNFLGSHFRNIDPKFLIEDFVERCSFSDLGGADVILCDDARPLDLEKLAEQGFSLVQISAPDALRRARKKNRDDRTSGNDQHPTETAGSPVKHDFDLDNSGKLLTLEKQIHSLVRTLSEPGVTGDRSVVSGEHGQAARLLVRYASETITPRYAENRHQIGAAILTGDGRVFTGLHLEAMVGRASICAEAVALGAAKAAGSSDLRAVVAVRHPKPSETEREIEVVPPCGLCRELLLDYGPQIQAVTPMADGLEFVSLAKMLPHKYVGTKWKNKNHTAQK